jgi:hypothetical protein
VLNSVFATALHSKGFVNTLLVLVSFNCTSYKHEFFFLFSYFLYIFLHDQVVKPGRSCFSFSDSAMSVSVRHCPTDQPPPNYSMVQNHMYYRLSAESNIPKGVPFRHNDVSTARVFPMEAISRAHWGSNGIRPTSIPPAPWTLCPRRRILFMVR